LGPATGVSEPFRSFRSFLKEKFPGQRVKKIPINAGFTCPNKDGRISNRGCIFCDEYGSGPMADFHLPIKEQIERFMAAHPGHKYLAYYQAHANTYAPVSELKEKYDIIFAYPDIIGLFIGTRPDAIDDQTYPLLEELNQRTYLCLELGLQSIHEQSLQFLNRGHTYSRFLQCFERLKAGKIDVLVHLILGIPGEDRPAMLDTVREMNRIQPAGIKFHLLHVLENTRLFDLYRAGKIRLLEMEEYCDLAVFLLERLDPGIVIHRLTSERERQIFHAPAWVLNKIAVINRIRAMMRERQSFQGKFLDR